MLVCLKLQSSLLLAVFKLVWHTYDYRKKAWYFRARKEKVKDKFLQ